MAGQTYWRCIGIQIEVKAMYVEEITQEKRRKGGGEKKGAGDKAL